MTKKYRPILPSQVPTTLRWDVPPQNQGQIVEVAYAHLVPSNDPACPGARYCRARDLPDGTTRYYAYGTADISKATIAAVFKEEIRVGWGHVSEVRTHGVWRRQGLKWDFIGDNFDHAAKTAIETAESRKASDVVLHGVEGGAA